MNRDYVRSNVRAGAPKEATPELIEVAIDAAAHTLGNLTHYQTGRSHYDEDVAYLARVLLAKGK